MKKPILCIVSLFLITLLVGCNSETNSNKTEVSGVVSGNKFYRIGFPETNKSDGVYAHKYFIEDNFDIDSTHEFGVAMPNLHTANDDTMAISGYNIEGKDKAIVYAGADRDYFIFYDGVISSDFSDKLLLKMSNVGDYMPYNEGEKYIKKYMK